MIALMRRPLLVIAFLAAALLANAPGALAAAAGTDWQIQTTPATDEDWRSITFGNGLFVALNSSGNVMTSPDGRMWTPGEMIASDVTWNSVTYGNSAFVAVGYSGTQDRVMTSTNGRYWEFLNPDNDGNWSAVTFGNGKFVAVGYDGGGSTTMTSTDGLEWDLIDPGIDENWMAVTFGDGRFVAVGYNGSSQPVAMFSVNNGETWTSGLPAAPSQMNELSSVTFGNGFFVAVSASSEIDGQGVMRSPDGLNWDLGTTADDVEWTSVVYGDGVFVAVSASGTGRRPVMTSSDGLSWAAHPAAAINQWRSVTYSSGLFVAVSSTGSGNQVMTSGTFQGGGPSLDPSQWTTYFQVIEIPVSGLCSDVSRQEETLAAYGTSVSGGWSKGWESWVNSGRGGWACWRILANTGGNTWIIAS